MTKRREILDNPPIVPSILVKSEIENQIPAIKEVYSPLPVVSQLRGVRVKLKYDDYHKEIEDVIVSDRRLGEYLKLLNLKCTITHW